MHTNFNIKYPKKAPQSLIKKTQKAVDRIESGLAQFRTTNRYGYRTLSLGGANRLVLIGENIIVFNRHSDYETFIDNPARA